MSEVLMCLECKEVPARRKYCSENCRVRRWMRETSKRRWAEMKADPARLGHANAMKRRHNQVHFAWVKEKYGMDAIEYRAFLEAHANRCDICSVTGVPMHIDHDHETGAVRGLLCQQCNHGLGNYKDDPDRLDRAATYLRTHALEMQHNPPMSSEPKAKRAMGFSSKEYRALPVDKRLELVHRYMAPDA